MLAPIVTYCSVLCFSMILPSVFWPQHFAPVGEQYRQFRLLGPALWASFGLVFFCWGKLLTLHASCGWCVSTMLLLPLAVTLTTSALFAFWVVQR